MTCKLSGTRLDLLELAAMNELRVTPSFLAVNSTVSYDDAKTMLDELAADGYLVSLADDEYKLTKQGVSEVGPKRGGTPLAVPDC